MKPKIAVDSEFVKAFDHLMVKMPWLSYRDFDVFVVDAVRDKLLKLCFAEKKKRVSERVVKARLHS
jgi:hypothetical protein